MLKNTQRHLTSFFTRSLASYVVQLSAWRISAVQVEANGWLLLAVDFRVVHFDEDGFVYEQSMLVWDSFHDGGVVCEVCPGDPPSMFLLHVRLRRSLVQMHGDATGHGRGCGSYVATFTKLAVFVRA